MKTESLSILSKINSLEQLKISQIIQKLRQIENRVIAHEMAHKAVAGRYAGAVSYSYTKGPDGKLYITGGEVSLDMKEESEPEETMKKMEVIIAAALAPSDPSPQDIRVAQAASIKKIKAQIELSQNEGDKTSGTLIDILA